jgi:hypothetical protein
VCQIKVFENYQLVEIGTLFMYMYLLVSSVEIFCPNAWIVECPLSFVESYTLPVPK